MGRLFQTFIRRVETASLVLWLLVVGAIWGFLKFAGEVSEGETLAVDKRILLALHNPGDPMGPRAFEESMRDVTALGGVTVLTLVTITATLALLFHGRRRHALVFASVVIATQVSATLLKDLYDRPRPHLVQHGSYVYSASFPSGHSTLSAATYLTLAMVIASLEPRTATKVLTFVVAGLVIIFVGFSRIYLGVHWPSDVLAGWVLGAAWALGGFIVLRTLQARKS